MLDSDLAKLYEIETKRINEAVKNNLIKFPERFRFTLSESEILNCLRSIFSTSNNIHRGGWRYIPRVFIKQCVVMLATILKSNIVIEVNKNIYTFTQKFIKIIIKKNIILSINVNQI